MQVEHFCEFSMLEGFQLIPISANVQVNETLNLQVMTCKSPDKEDDVLASLVYKPYPVEDISVSASKWSVNGVLGGNATLGTITGSGLSATFTAPATQPDPKTVAASVELNELGHQEKILLFSSITIGLEGYHGEFQVSATGPYIAWTGTGEATWTLNDEGEFDVSGTITPDQTDYPYGDCTCILEESTKSFENIGQVRDQTDPPTVYWAITPLYWNATCECENGNQQLPGFLVFMWASGYQNEWCELDNSYPEHIKGTYTKPQGLNQFTVTWDFIQQD